MLNSGDAEKEISILEPEEENRWRKFLKPTSRELENEFHYVQNHDLTKNEDQG